jgi:hypothetical protein
VSLSGKPIKNTAFKEKTMRKSKSIWILLGLAAVVPLIFLSCPQKVDEPSGPTSQELAQMDAEAVLAAAGATVGTVNALPTPVPTSFSIQITGGIAGYSVPSTSKLKITSAKYNGVEISGVSATTLTSGVFSITVPTKSIIEKATGTGSINVIIAGHSTLDGNDATSTLTKSIEVTTGSLAQYSGTLSSLINVAKLLRPTTAGGLINSNANYVDIILAGSVGTLYSGTSGQMIVPLVFDDNMPSVTLKNSTNGWILAGSVGTDSSYSYRTAGSFSIGSGSIENAWMGGTLGIMDVGSGGGANNTTPTSENPGSMGVYFNTTGSNAKIILDAEGFAYELPAFGVVVYVH